MKDKTKKLIKTVFISLPIFLILFLFYQSLPTVKVVKAQSLLPLTVAPARQEITVDPGQKTGADVRFYNLGDNPISGLIKVADFIVQDKEGSPRIIENVSQASPRFSASTWIKLPYDRITIAANDKVSIPLTLTVPANARPGGRYLAVYFEPTASIPQPIGGQKEGGSAVTPRLSSLLYIRVNGPITEKALVSRLFARSFNEYGPITVETEILNRGDYHIRPKGVFTLTDMFGATVDQVTLKEQNIFPDVSRTYTNQLGEKWMFGRYKINLAASYGEQGKALEKFIYIWVFPWRVTLAVTLSVFIIAYLLYHIYKTSQLKQAALEKELKEEQKEIEKLKEQLKKRDE